MHPNITNKGQLSVLEEDMASFSLDQKQKLLHFNRFQQNLKKKLSDPFYPADPFYPTLPYTVKTKEVATLTHVPACPASSGSSVSGETS